MTKISACLIVKNEEKLLSRCLDSIKDLCNEIVIVDTGSTDKTKEIAAKYTDKVFDYVWNDNFSDSRNFSLSKATGDWILVMDADEVISASVHDKIREAVKNDEPDAFFLIQRNYTSNNNLMNFEFIKEHSLEESMKYSGFVKNPLIRLFRNNKAIVFSGSVHETVEKSIISNSIKTGKLDIPIHHFIEENDIAERQLKYLAIAEKNLEKNPNGRDYYTAGSVCLHFKKDYDKAIKYLTKAAELDFKKIQALEGVAECLIHKKDFEHAYSIYKELVRSGNASASVCNNLGNLFVMHKKYELGLKYLKIAVEKGSANKKRIEENIRKVEAMMEKKQ
ncbi:MAG: glycosyltransferase [Nanoarchaeota archaeon]|nr:glycosyltransferase [Nanoarchaeota archaeon]